MADITAVYNGYTIPNIYDKFFFSKSYTKAVFSCTFVVTSDTESNFVTACALAESKLRDRYATFTLTFGATAEYSFSHSANTGFLQEASLDKITNELSTARSRAYKFSLELSLPADLTGYDFRQEAQIAMEQSIQQRKIVNISGKYTGSPDGGSGVKTAKQNYDTYGPTWANAIAAGLVGSAELLHSSVSYEQENKILSFSRRYQEKTTIAVVYNSYSIPASYNNFTLSEQYNTLSFSCEFAVSHSSADTAEIALRQKNKDLTMSFGGSPQYSYGHTANTGFLAVPNLALISNTSDDDTLRFYRFSLVCELPADAVGYGYRRDANFTIAYPGSRRRTVNFTLTYTAGGASSALANYTLAGKTWAASILTSLGGAYELISENVREEMEQKICNSTLVYNELLTNDSESELNVASIVLAQCDYSVNLGQEYGLSEAGFNSLAPVTVTVNYSAQISRDAVVLDTGINDIYINTIRPWLVKHAYDVLGLTNFSQSGQNYVAQNENYRINPHTYAVSGSITFIAPRSSSQIIQLSETITMNKNAGITYQKIWDGKPNTYNIYSLGEQRLFRRSIQVLQLANLGIWEPPSLGPEYIQLDIQRNIQKKRVGAGSGTAAGLGEITLYVASFTQNFLYVAGLANTGGVY